MGVNTRKYEFASDLIVEAHRVFRFRELLRGRAKLKRKVEINDGPHGFQHEDIDLILRWRGGFFNLDDTGRFRFLELKRRNREPEINPRTGEEDMGGSKQWTFGLIDSLLRQSPASEWRYDGFFLVEHDNDNFDDTTTLWVNGHKMDVYEFLDWCLEPFSPIPGLTNWPRSLVIRKPRHYG